MKEQNQNIAEGEPMINQTPNEFLGKTPPVEATSVVHKDLYDAAMRELTAAKARINGITNENNWYFGVVTEAHKALHSPDNAVWGDLVTPIDELKAELTTARAECAELKQVLERCRKDLVACIDQRNDFEKELDRAKLKGNQ